jgi:hypothetical protein
VAPDVPNTAPSNFRQIVIVQRSSPAINAAILGKRREKHRSIRNREQAEVQDSAEKDAKTPLSAGRLPSADGASD